MERQKDTLRLRRVTSSDRDLLYLWCNDPQCRENSLNPAKISYEEHCLWFAERLASPDCRIFICIDGENEVGQVRLDLTGREFRVSYSIAAEYRGWGLGYRMLQKMEEEIPQGVETLHAVVKEKNIASQRCFQKLGYQRQAGEHGYHFWKTFDRADNATEGIDL